MTDWTCTLGTARLAQWPAPALIFGWLALRGVELAGTICGALVAVAGCRRGCQPDDADAVLSAAARGRRLLSDSRLRPAPDDGRRAVAVCSCSRFPPAWRRNCVSGRGCRAMASTTSRICDRSGSMATRTSPTTTACSAWATRRTCSRRRRPATRSRHGRSGRASSGRRSSPLAIASRRCCTRADETWPWTARRIRTGRLSASPGSRWGLAGLFFCYRLRPCHRAGRGRHSPWSRRGDRLVHPLVSREGTVDDARAVDGGRGDVHVGLGDRRAARGRAGNGPRWACSRA